MIVQFGREFLSASAEELADRVLFFLQNYHLFCSNISKENVIISGKDLTTHFSKLKQLLESKPTECFPEGFLPALLNNTEVFSPNYGRMSNEPVAGSIQSMLLADKLWKAFTQNCDTGKRCHQVAVESDGNLEEQIKRMKWSEEVEKNDKNLQVFEQEFVKSVNECLHSRPLVGSSNPAIVHNPAPVQFPGKSTKDKRKGNPVADQQGRIIQPIVNTGVRKSLKWPIVIVVSVVFGVALILAAAAIQNYHSQQQLLN